MTFRDNNVRDVHESIPSYRNLIEPESTETVQTHPGNVFTGYALFFVASWIMTSATYLLTAKRWEDPFFIVFILFFFVFQIIGSLYFGVRLDLYGRSSTLKRGSTLLCVGLFFVLSVMSLIDVLSISSSFSSRSIPSWPIPFKSLNISSSYGFFNVDQTELARGYIPRISGPVRGKREQHYQPLDIFFTSLTLSPDSVAFSNQSDGLESMSTTNSTTTTTLTTTNVTTTLPVAPTSLLAYGSRWALLGAISVLGTAVGGAYPISSVITAESVSASNRLMHLGGLFCMQGLSQVTSKLTLGAVFHQYPTTTPDQAFTLLIVVAFAASLVVRHCAHVMLEETLPYKKCYQHQPASLSPYDTSIAVSRVDAGKPLLMDDDGSSRILGDPLHAYLLEETKDNLPPRTHRPSATETASPEWSDGMSMKRQTANGFTIAHPTAQKYYKSVSAHCSILRYHVWGSSIPWFFLDLSFYGDGVFHSLLVHHIRGFETASAQNLFELLVAFVALLGAVTTIGFLKRIVPKLFQILGFIVMAFVYFGLALSLFSIAHTSEVDVVSTPTENISAYLGASLLYDCVFRLSTVIPSLTCFIIPLDAFPTRVRGTFDGLTVALSRLGAFIGLLISWNFITLRRSRAPMLSIYSLTALLAASITRAITPHIQPQQEDLVKLDLLYLLKFNTARDADARQPVASGRSAHRGVFRNGTYTPRYRTSAYG